MIDDQLRKDVEDLKAIANNQIVQLAVVSAQKNTLQSALLGLCRSKLSDEEYGNFYSNFVNRLEEETEGALNRLDNGILFGDVRGFLIRQKFEFFEAMNRMKEDRSYIANSKNTD